MRIVLCGALLAAAPLAAQRPDTWAVTNVTVIPMDRPGALADQTVVVRAGRIVELGPASRVRVPAGAGRIDGRGKFLVPGLAEMHAHVPPGNASDQEIERVLELFALHGVTTVRSMLGIPRHLAYRDRAARGELLSPRIVTSGPSLNGQSVPTPEAAIRLVTDERAAGYDFLKIHPGIPRAAFDSAAATADRLGIRFGGHVPLAVGLHRALAARSWTIDHLDGYVEALVRDGAPLRPEQSAWFGLNLARYADESRLPALVAATRAAGTGIVPTMSFIEAQLGPTPVEELEARPELRHVQAAMVQGWANNSRQMRANPEHTPERRAEFLALRRRILKALHDGGVPILLGSDAPQLWNVPGHSLAAELGHYVEAGLTAWQALATGTVNVARFLGDAEGGAIAPGKRADLLLLEADPLADVRHVTRTAGVFVGGRWVPGDEIARRLEALALR